ncbi:MAG: hypothetical protein MJZ11_03695 [Lachnospiraceae bacterium]|nr:hypothetical protein [Lachnospiraceae bacterium]
MKKTDTNGIKTSLLTALFTGFTLGIFAPLEMFFANVTEFWFDFSDISMPILLQFIIIFLLTFSISRLGHLINKTLEKIANCFFIFLTTLLYVQGNFMQIDYGHLGDETIDFSEFEYVGIPNTVGWIGMLTILIMLVILKKYDHFIKIYRVVMICIFLVQLSTLLIIGVTSKGYEHKNNYIATTDNYWNYSKEENMIVIVADTFDSRVLYDIMESNDANKEKCEDILENFTFYRDTICSFNLTDFSIPQIITGEKYLNQSTYGEFCDDAYSKSPWLNRLKNENWDTSIYTTVTLPQGEIAQTVSNWHKLDYNISDSIEFMLSYNRILAFRYLPHYLKEKIYYSIDNLDDYKIIESIDGREPLDNEFEYSWENLVFNQSIGFIGTNTNNKSMHLIHMKGLHSLRDLDFDLNSIDIKDRNEELSLEDTGEIVLSIFEGYFKKLKELGIYDNSTIVIMADHGASSYTIEFVNQNALLLVKGKNEKHNFKISEKPISFDNIQDGFLNLMDGKTDNDVFNIKDDANKIRYTYVTRYEGALKSLSKSATFIEYQTEYPSYESTKARRTGNEY